MEAQLQEASAALSFRDCITFHDSVVYLADDLGLTVAASLSIGEESGIAASEAAEAQEAAARAGRVWLLYDGQYPVEYAYVGDRAEESRAVVLNTAVIGSGTRIRGFPPWKKTSASSAIYRLSGAVAGKENAYGKR